VWVCVIDQCSLRLGKEISLRLTKGSCLKRSRVERPVFQLLHHHLAVNCLKCNNIKMNSRLLLFLENKLNDG
jgi:hypothetical protein